MRDRFCATFVSISRILASHLPLHRFLDSSMHIVAASLPRAMSTTPPPPTALVYNGPGAGARSVASAIESLRAAFQPTVTVRRSTIRVLHHAETKLCCQPDAVMCCGCRLKPSVQRLCCTRPGGTGVRCWSCPAVRTCRTVNTSTAGAQPSYGNSLNPEGLTSAFAQVGSLLSSYHRHGESPSKHSCNSLVYLQGRISVAPV
jgi:hypothetical protein